MPSEQSTVSNENPKVACSTAAILAAGDQILEAEGVRGITIEAVAERSDVGRTTIYRSCPSKAELVADPSRLVVLHDTRLGGVRVLDPWVPALGRLTQPMDARLDAARCDVENAHRSQPR
jgi:Bacterial regulatory proteins, tetR family